MTASLVEIVERFAEGRLLVIGDLMLDEYVWGNVSRISPEAPIPVVDVRRVSFAPGGAANVAANISSLGGKVVLCGILGDDEAGRQLRRELEKYPIHLELVLAPRRQTTHKTRIIAHSQQVVRVDRENKFPISRGIAEKLIQLVSSRVDSVDALLVSDYAKGMTTPGLMRTVISMAKERGKPIIVDPKGADYKKYRGATMITPNEAEAGEAVGRKIADESTLLYALNKMRVKLGTEAILISRGEKGLSLLEGDDSIIHLPTFARDVYDVTGAGDTLVGVLTLALAVGAAYRDAARIANHAAGIAVSRVGTATITAEELKKSILWGAES